ncbi:F-box/LRR-repeat protein At3g26922-like [Carex rostrata]
MMEGRDLAWDRISGLPDPLLTHILSFLPIEEAVRTCILSKRWVKVWVSLPVLVFDNRKCKQDNLTKEEFQKREEKYLRFFCSVILNRENLTLDTFKLTWWGSNVRDTLLHIFKYFCCAVECRPRILSIHIDIDTKTLPGLTDSIFKCTSVEEMSLWLEIDYLLYEDSFIKPKPFNLPFLQKLELYYLNLNNDIMRMFISGCPVIEELVLLKCVLEWCMISFKVLKKLVLKYCHHCGPMEISCPRVVSLSIESINTEGITLKNMSSLVTADILCAPVFSSLATVDHLKLRLLGGLSNVTSLKLYSGCPYVMYLLRADIPNCPTLKNLQSLDLGEIKINCNWNWVACLLKHSSNLKDLTLHFFRPGKDAAKEEFQGDISFQNEYLEAVKINCPGKNVKLAGELIRTSGTLVETTAKIIIL